MTRRPLVTVVVPAYDVEAYLEGAVRSVQAQGVDDVEIVIVDDGSRDGTLALARRLAAEDPRVRVIAQPNSGGPAAPRNAAIRATTSEYVAFLDPDDYWHPTKLARQLAVLAARPDVDLVFADADLVAADGASLGATYLGRADYRARAAAHLVDVSDDIVGHGVYVGGLSFYAFAAVHNVGALTSGVTVRRAALNAQPELFPTDLPVGEDIDLYFRVMARGGVAYIDAPLHAYRQHAASLMQDEARVLAGQVAAHARNFRRSAPVLPEADRRAYRRRIADQYFGLGYHRWRARDASGARAAYRASFAWRAEVRTAAAFAKTLLPRWLRPRNR